MILSRRSFASVALVAASTLIAAPLLGGCDNGKASEEAAFRGLDVAFPMVDRDTKQVRDGMPEGAKFMTTMLPDDPVGKREELKTAIKATRAHVESLMLAKNTVFAFTSPDGMGLRSEADSDPIVDQNMFQLFPDLAKSADPKAGLVEAYGKMDSLRTVKKGEDLQWIAAIGVADKEGKPKGVFLTGLSLRAYAHSLETQTRTRLGEIAKEKGEKNIALTYVYIVKGKAAYGDPDAPDVNATKLVELDVVGKSASGDYKTHVDIDGRTFGIAARKCPSFGDDAAIAIVASVF